MKDNVAKKKLVQTTQSPEVEYSQVRRQERAQNSNPWKQEVSSHSTSTKKLVQTETPRTELQNMKYTNHQCMTKVFHFHSRTLNIFDGSYTDTCVDMGKVHVFVNDCSHSSWTELFGEFGDLQEHELRGTSELIQYHTEIDIGAC